MLFLLIFLALDAEITLKDPKATNTIDCLQPFKPLFSHGFRVKIFPSFECAGHIHSFENAPQALRPVVSAHCRLKIDQPRRSIRADKHIAKAAEIEMHNPSRMHHRNQVFELTEIFHRNTLRRDAFE